MFYSVVKSKIKTKNGKKLCELSNNQYCIGIGCDRNNLINIVENLEKISIDKTIATFKNHIKKNSIIIHDDEKSHRKLVKDLKLTDESYKSLWLKIIKIYLYLNFKFKSLQLNCAKSDLKKIKKNLIFFLNFL